MKPVVLVTRKLPDAVEARLRQDFDARLNPTDTLYSVSEIMARADGADAILLCHTEKIYRRRVRAPARIGQGDRQFLRWLRSRRFGSRESAWAGGDQHARGAFRIDRRTDDHADAGRGTAGERRRPFGAKPPVAGLEPGVHGGHPDDRKAVGHPRIRPGRAIGGQAGQKLRHDDPLHRRSPAAGPNSRKGRCFTKPPTTSCRTAIFSPSIVPPPRRPIAY